jgi:hypothetical protein
MTGSIISRLASAMVIRRFAAAFDHAENDVTLIFLGVGACACAVSSGSDRSHRLRLRQKVAPSCIDLANSVAEIPDRFVALLHFQGAARFGFALTPFLPSTIRPMAMNHL